jgi:hypothetical protein
LLDIVRILRNTYGFYLTHLASYFPSARFTYETSTQSLETREMFGTVELHLPGPVGKASRPGYVENPDKLIFL